MAGSLELVSGDSPDDGDVEYQEACAWLVAAADGETQAEVYLEETLTEFDGTENEALLGANAGCAEAMLNMKAAKDHMNRLAKSRGYFKGFIDGELQQSQGGGKPTDARTAASRASMRCFSCGRLGHLKNDPACPKFNQAAGGPAVHTTSSGSGGKGRGKSKGKAMLAMMGITLLTVFTNAGSDSGSWGFWGSQGQDRTEHAAYPAVGMLDFDFLEEALSAVRRNVDTAGVIDTGCTVAVAGLDWLEGIEKVLDKFGLRPIKEPCHEVFHGLGGVKRTASVRWIVPVCVFNVHTVLKVAQLDAGTMFCLLSKDFMKELGYNWYSRTNTHDFEAIQVFGVKLDETPNGLHLLDLMGFEQGQVISDAKLNRFRVQTAESGLQCGNAALLGQLEVEASRIRTELCSSHSGPLDPSRCSTLPGPVRKQVAKTVVEVRAALMAMQDGGRTLLWEVFAGAHNTTVNAIKGGHIAGQPVDILLFIDLFEARQRNQFFKLMDEFEPLVVTVAFPCDPWSTLTNLTIAQGYTENIYAKRSAHMVFLTFARDILMKQLRAGRFGLAENPWSSLAWQQEPLQDCLRHGYVLVKADQCGYGLVNEQGIPHKKPTGFMVPAGSTFERRMPRQCSQDHVHALVIGGGRTTKGAGVWPHALAQEIVSCACEEAAGRAPVTAALVTTLSRASYDSMLVLQDRAQIHRICDELYLRFPAVSMAVIRGDAVKNGRLPIVCGDALVTRRIIIGYDRNQQLTIFEDDWHPKPDISVQSVIELDDSLLMIEIYPEEQVHAFPAVRERLNVRSEPYVTSDGRRPRLQGKHGSDGVRRDDQPDPPALPLVEQPEDDGEAVGPDLPAVPVQMHDGYGPKPAGINDMQYSALKRLHSNLAHPSAASMVRMLRRWKAHPDIIKAAEKLQCSVCQEVRGRDPSRRAAPSKRAKQFNQIVAFDEFEVTLSDGTAQLILMITDEASGYSVTVPLEGRKLVPTDTVTRSLDIGWISWAGPPECLRFDSARPHLSAAMQQFCRTYGITEYVAPPEAHNANPAVEKRIDFWKDHFMKVSSELSLTKSDDAWTWCNKITAAQNQHFRYGGFSPNQWVFGRDPRAPTSLLSDEARLLAVQETQDDVAPARRAEDIRRSAQRAMLELDDARAVSAALSRQKRGPRMFSLGDVVYYWRTQGTTTQSKRLQEAAAWRGPAVIVGIQGTSKYYISSWGTIILVTPEQLRMASSDEGDLLNHLDTLSEVIEQDLSSHRQMGFVDERAPVPAEDGQDVQMNQGGQQVPIPQHPQPQPQALDQPQAADVQPTATTTATDVHPTTTTTSKRQGTSQPSQPSQPTERPPPQHIPHNNDVHEVDSGDDGPAAKRSRTGFLAKVAFMVSRQEYVDAKHMKKAQKGRELNPRRLPRGTENDYNEAKRKEWQKHIGHDVFDIEWELSAESLEKQGKNVLTLRYVLTDKNGNVRGDKSYGEVPVEARARLVTPGFLDLDNLEGKLKKDAPTLPHEALSMVFQVAASKRWPIVQGDVEAAFLSGAYFEREVYVKAPRGGLPATETTPGIPEGTVLRLKKSMPGLADAPLEWHNEHKQGLLELGFQESGVAKALYLYYSDVGLEGILGVHVDDDIMAGSEFFMNDVIPRLRKRFNYGRWAMTEFMHTGRSVKQDLTDFSITVGQAEYSQSLQRIYLTADRRKEPHRPANSDEVSALRAGGGKVAWLVRNSRPDGAFKLARLMQRISQAKVQDVLDFNSLVGDMKRDAHLTIKFYSIPLQDLEVIGWSDASFANVGVSADPDDEITLESQAGWVLGFTSRQALAQGQGKVSIAAWLSHKLKRKVRSTLAAETMAANECLESADILRAHLVEVTDKHPIDRRQWRDLVKRIPVTLVIDSKSLYDFLHKQGSTPAEKRLRLDLEMIRDQMREDSLTIRWVASQQQLADVLTKGGAEAFLYLKLVLETGEFAIMFDERMNEMLREFRVSQRATRQENFTRTTKSPKTSPSTKDTDIAIEMDTAAVLRGVAVGAASFIALTSSCCRGNGAVMEHAMNEGPGKRLTEDEVIERHWQEANRDREDIIAEAYNDAGESLLWRDNEASGLDLSEMMHQTAQDMIQERMAQRRIEQKEAVRLAAKQRKVAEKMTRLLKQ